MYCGFYISDSILHKINIGNEDDKTLYFNDFNMLSSIDVFCQTVFSIYRLVEMTKKSLSANLLICQNVSPEDQFIALTEIMRLNHLLDKTLPFLRKMTHLANAWKIGASLSENDVESAPSITCHFYRITKLESNEFLRIYDLEDRVNLFSSYSSKSHSPDESLIRGAMDAFVASCINSAFGKLNAMWLLPDMALGELAFNFLDRFACLFDNSCSDVRRYSKDMEEVVTLEKAISCILRACEENVGQWRKELQVDTEIPAHGNYHFGIDLKDILRDSNSITKIMELFQGCDSPYDIVPSFKFTDEIGYRLSPLLAELKARNIKEVRRLWHVQNTSFYPRLGYADNAAVKHVLDLIEWTASGVTFALERLFGDNAAHYLPKARGIVMPTNDNRELTCLYDTSNTYSITRGSTLKQPVSPQDYAVVANELGIKKALSYSISSMPSVSFNDTPLSRCIMEWLRRCLLRSHSLKNHSDHKYFRLPSALNYFGPHSN